MLNHTGGFDEHRNGRGREQLWRMLGNGTQLRPRIVIGRLSVEPIEVHDLFDRGVRLARDQAVAVNTARLTLGVLFLPGLIARGRFRRGALVEFVDAHLEVRDTSGLAKRALDAVIPIELDGDPVQSDRRSTRFPRVLATNRPAVQGHMEHFLGHTATHKRRLHHLHVRAVLGDEFHELKIALANAAKLVHRRVVVDRHRLTPNVIPFSV
ncbi:MAG: hypothetical protein HY027_07905 [Deltaproteobacteria bacterium]|nr:hypothetical protein [Deltaproteobacteria bacterium]